MSFSIITKNGEKTFEDKEIINISSKEGFDVQLDLGFDYMLSVQYDEESQKCKVLNQFGCDKFLFKGQPLPQTLEVEKMCKIMLKDSDEFITVRVNAEKNPSKIVLENISEQDIKNLYGTQVNAAAKLMIEKRKSEIEEARVAIIKQISYSINDLKHKISMNSKAGIVLHIGLFLASMILAFGVSNYLTGLPLKESGSIIQLPVNIKLLFVYSLIVYGIGIVLKQGMYLFLQNKLGNSSSDSNIAEKLLIISSSLFYAGLYFINVLYYFAPGTMPFFAVFMSFFFTLACVILALACGYFKSNNVSLSKELSQYEYREDFEQVIKEYQLWIERYINNLTKGKISQIKDKLFNLQIKSVGETILGILTTPFLAYGVSNTLAMCFPDAAGWVRISGLRFSPVFLVLASFMIVFAFFAFVNAFWTNKKIQASNVLKNDGFSNYLQHGVEIYGLQGVKKLDVDMRRSFIIGLCIIFIEFSMNISYFMQEIGGDLNGILLSSVAALVPTALLIAETYMLSQTKFEIFACDGLLSKFDRE